jgi:hypothetical protein
MAFIFNLTHMTKRWKYFISAYSHDAIQKKWLDWASQEVLDVDDNLYLHTNIFNGSKLFGHELFG